MKKNSLKKLIGVITLGLAIAIGSAVGGQGVQTVEAMVPGAVSLGGFDDYVLENFGDYFGYPAYGVYPDGSSYYGSEDEIRDLVKTGFLGEVEGNLEIRFLKATTEDEKEEVYKQLIDEVRDVYGLSDSEVERLKNAGYKNYNRTLDEIFYDQLVDEGFMTRREADLQIQYSAATSKEEREAVYDLMVDNMVDLGEVTREQGDKLKADGYASHYDNMSNFDFESMVDELLKEGAITKEQADDFNTRKGDAWGELIDVYDKYFMTKDLVDAGIITTEKATEFRNSDSYESWKELNDAYNKYYVDVAVREGDMTQEAADLWMAYVVAESEEDITRAYSNMLDYEVRMGIITQEEADLEKEFGFVIY